MNVRVPNSGWNASSAAVEVGAFVEGVVEEGGSCTLKLTKGSKIVTAQANASADAAITGCGDLSVSGASLSSGTWSATVSYASVTSAGTSAALDIEVP
ncbi:hypothetical protein [Pengzhenrongella phosphoraccumulans]|uniref:hypothetical protein n=1 Tax=Pengzhenrongella phosphoraccumulans TaxID=3114394 RepID=UPI00388F0769